MRVIFLQDVPNVARAGEVREVADGYARHFLIPRKLATMARSGVVNLAEIISQAQAREEAEISDLAQRLEGMEITLKARAGARERLFGSITTADIAAGLSEVSGLAIDKRKIELGEPIRHLGSFEVGIRLGKDAMPKVTVIVVEETVKDESLASSSAKPAKKKKPGAAAEAEKPEAPADSEAPAEPEEPEKPEAPADSEAPAEPEEADSSNEEAEEKA